MILKFVYRSTGYYGTENAFYVDFKNKIVSDRAYSCDREVNMKKSGECDSLKEFFVKHGFKEVDCNVR